MTKQLLISFILVDSCSFNEVRYNIEDLACNYLQAFLMSKKIFQSKKSKQLQKSNRRNFVVTYKFHSLFKIGALVTVVLKLPSDSILNISDYEDEFNSSKPLVSNKIQSVWMDFLPNKTKVTAKTYRKFQSINNNSRLVFDRFLLDQIG